MAHHVLPEAFALVVYGEGITLEQVGMTDTIPLFDHQTPLVSSCLLNNTFKFMLLLKIVSNPGLYSCQTMQVGGTNKDHAYLGLCQPSSILYPFHFSTLSLLGTGILSSLSGKSRTVATTNLVGHDSSATRVLPYL